MQAFLQVILYSMTYCAMLGQKCDPIFTVTAKMRNIYTDPGPPIRGVYIFHSHFEILYTHSLDTEYRGYTISKRIIREFYYQDLRPFYRKKIQDRISLDNSVLMCKHSLLASDALEHSAFVKVRPECLLNINACMEYYG